jgi:RNA polymerase sigma factor (sigma-70 family)
MTVRDVLTEPEETALAAAVEAGIIAEEALAGGFGVDATILELAVLVREGHEARERLLLANTGLVKAIARGELGMSPAELSEVIQEGFLAMAEALLRFDHRRGRFGPYAAAWIRARVRTAITTQCGQVEVPVKELMRHFARRRAETDLMQTLGRTVSAAEVPGGTRPSLQLILSRASLEATHQVVDEKAGRHLECPDQAPDLRELLARLPPDQRLVVRRRFGMEGSPVSRAELADELGLSESTVRRIESRGLESLRRSLARLDAA